ncbi:esterase/lipase family protein [Noviherbaspirillum suwonense]|uniref:esterase/lipase family protein n=1 Tax=Noviherbaspirillum suwonense TaxID=1224511 RepID=UPI0024B70F40|nr:alpha/beta hydrolase [Noviherbaspirillum suwonense]
MTRWKGWILTLQGKNSTISQRAPRRRRTPGQPAALAGPGENAHGWCRRCHLHPSDFHGLRQLAATALEGGLDLAQELHESIAGAFLRIQPVGALTAFLYQKARSSSRILDRCLTRLLPPHSSRPAGWESTAEREAVLAAINGLIGDHLAESGNPMQIPMRLRVGGKPLPATPEALAAALKPASGKLLVLIHGLCRSDLQWRRNHHDHGEALARDLGYTAVYLHYNSGLHISSNGKQLAGQLEALYLAWPVPVEEISIVGHSMGGLLARSACHYAGLAGHEWLAHLRNMVFLGTPHHGASLERGGNWLTAVLGRNRYTAPFARLGRIRSAGITDLRYGNLRDEDWVGLDRFEHGDDRREPVPLPRGVRCYAVAGSVGKSDGDLRERLLGDGLIPLDTALGKHVHGRHSLSIPKSRQWVAYGVHHLDLLSSLAVYQRIRSWLAPAGMRSRRSARRP